MSDIIQDSAEESGPEESPNDTNWPLEQGDPHWAEGTARAPYTLYDGRVMPFGEIADKYYKLPPGEDRKSLHEHGLLAIRRDIADDKRRKEISRRQRERGHMGSEIFLPKLPKAESDDLFQEIGLAASDAEPFKLQETHIPTEHGDIHLTGKPNLDYSHGVTEDQARANIHGILGHPYEPEHVASALGFRDDMNVRVESHPGGGLSFVGGGPHEHYDARRSLGKSFGSAVVYNKGFYLNPLHSTGKGIGTGILSHQVKNLRTMGVDKLITHASGSALNKGDNGYYTWPRLGYDAPIRPEYLSKMVGTPYEGVETLHKLFQKPGGAQWWKENGGGHTVGFHLDPESKSSQILARYLEERGMRPKTDELAQSNASPRPIGVEGNDLSDEEHRILDAVWEKHGHLGHEDAFQEEGDSAPKPSADEEIKQYAA